MDKMEATDESVDAVARVLAAQFAKNPPVNGSKDFRIDARAVLAEINRQPDGVNSDLNTCPGCQATVIGHETCGDPTRPQCASNTP